MNNNKSSFAFTLIELLLIMIILGVLATLISGNFFTSLKKGRDARRKADLEQIRKALEMYYEDKRAYPTSIPGSATGFVFGDTFKDPATEKVYMQKVPNDPSGRNYLYISNGQSYGLYACLENSEQILPYESKNYGSFSCSYNCKKQDGSTTSCIFGISDSNSQP